MEGSDFFQSSLRLTRGSFRVVLPQKIGQVTCLGKDRVVSIKHSPAHPVAPTRVIHKSLLSNLSRNQGSLTKVGSLLRECRGFQWNS